jgi:hypothetical protein
MVCSECGLSWDSHTKGRKTAPTLETCVVLLKAQLALQPSHRVFAYPSGFTTSNISLAS